MKLIAMTITLVFACALPGCATLARKSPTVLPQDKSIALQGYTTNDGVHHACAGCTARLVRGASPEGAEVWRVQISAPTPERSGASTRAMDLSGSTTDSPASIEDAATQSIDVADLTSIDVSEGHVLAAVLVVLGIGLVVLLLLAVNSFPKDG